MLPSLFVPAVLFDRRMTHDQIVICKGFVTLIQIPAFGDADVSLRVEGVADTFGLAAPWGGDPECSSVLQPLMSDPDDPLLWYTVLDRTSSPSLTNSEASSLCDYTSNGTDQSCLTSVRFTFGNIILSTSTSEPGISKLEIFLNLGAIVGAVQFFVWFLTIFNY